jgi:D-3-phosphoglycerate dehydrogenase
MKPVVLCVQPLLYPQIRDFFGPDVDLRFARDPSPAAVAEDAQDAHAIFVRTGAGVHIGAEVFSAAPRLLIVSPLGSGVDMIDVDAATEAGVTIMHNPGSAPTPVVEFVIGMIPTLRKRIVEADRAMRSGWDWLPRDRFFGSDSTGATLGVIGFGHIGREVARRARGAFDMRIVVFDPAIDAATAAAEGAELVTDLHELLTQADVVTLHAPSMPSTRHMIDAAALAAMKPDAVLINSARGPLVDHDALADALRERTISAAAMDVFDPEPLRPDHPLLKLENFVGTPHTAGMSHDSVIALHRAASSGILGALKGTRPPHLANPQMWPPRVVETQGWPLAG